MFYLRLALFFALLYWGLSYMMDNTMIGERFAETAEQSNAEFTESESTNDVLNTLLGDRAIQYEMGFGLFLIHPLTGIGISNFMPVTGFPYRLHTEYMVQLCENGIIGFSLLMLFYYFLIKKLLERRRMGEDITLVMFGIYAILFLNITTWTYCQNFGLIYYGIIIAYAYSDSNWLDDEEDDEMEDVETSTLEIS
jgi:O-antigen ligase